MAMLRSALAVLLVASIAHAVAASRQAIDIAAIDDDAQAPRIAQGALGAPVVRAQILLDRAWFSVGEIDGRFGENMRKAVRAFQSARGLAESGVIDAATWEALNDTDDDVLTTYTITEKDAAGPFTRVPRDIMDQARLPRLGYQNIAEMLSERFHVAPALLRELNPEASFVAGEDITVPDVQATKASAKVASVAILKRERVLRALDREGHVVAQFPVSLGTRREELETGRFKIVSALRNPVFRFDPAKLDDRNPRHAKARIAPGPNSPIGVVWLGLDKPHYGIHGTPEPSKVGRTQTHGCVHLTNWDALKLAAVAAPGVPVDVRG
ncbi:MAG: L,D-transpeptidase family protein [Bacillota bacterium]